MAEGRSVLIKADRQVLYVFLFNHLEQHAQKTVYRIGVHAVGVHHRQGVESPVHEAVAVHQQKDILQGSPSVHLLIQFLHYS